MRVGVGLPARPVDMLVAASDCERPVPLPVKGPGSAIFILVKEQRVVV